MFTAGALDTLWFSFDVNDWLNSGSFFFWQLRPKLVVRLRILLNVRHWLWALKYAVQNVTYPKKRMIFLENSQRNLLLCANYLSEKLTCAFDCDFDSQERHLPAWQGLFHTFVKMFLTPSKCQSATFLCCKVGSRLPFCKTLLDEFCRRPVVAHDQTLFMTVYPAYRD
jgi:hypothetical protein